MNLDVNELHNSTTWPRKKRRPGKPVTLIVGIICKDAIVLAADSQTTKGNARQLGANKISVADFKNGKAIIAESGSASLSVSAIQVFQRMALATKIENELTIAKTAEAAIRNIRAELMSQHPNSSSPIDWQNFFFQEVNYFELMIAYFFEGRPCLYKLNPAWCIPVTATSHFMTSGIASDLANYILQEYSDPKMDNKLASVIAIKVIEDAIEYVEGCGSPPRVAVIQTPTETPGHPLRLGLSERGEFSRLPQYTEPVVVFPQKRVEEISRIIASVEKQAKETRIKKIHKALRNETLKVFKEFMKDLTPETVKKLKELRE